MSPCDTRDVIGSVPEFPTAETFRLDHRPLDVHPRFLTIFPFLPLPTAHAAYARRMLNIEQVPLAAITGQRSTSWQLLCVPTCC
jgi:hypothetical protein